MTSILEHASRIAIVPVYVAGAASVALAVYLLLLAVYRLTLHPLARYPGPFLAKITPWRDVYHAWRGDKHLDFYELHQRYGPFVRYGPNTLSINDPAALKAIYGHRANVRKSDFYLAFPAAPGVFSTHTALDRHAHARKRRVMSHAFSDAALKGVEDYVLGYVRSFVGKLAGGGQGDAGVWSPARDVSEWSTYLGFDVMGDLSFGKSFNMLEGDVPENREAAFLLTQAAKRHNITGPMPWLHQSGLDRILFRKINQDRDKYLAFSRKQVGQRTQSDVWKSDRKDFFYYLLNSKDPETGQGFGKAELWGESNTLIIAGSDTTSTTLTGAIFYLLHNPSSLERLTTEIRSTFASAEDIRSGPALNGCSFLRACIDEAMRLSPPVGAVLPRVVLEGGLNVLGHHIPAGTGVGCPIYALHHHAEYVPDAFEYRPERWLATESAGGEEAVKRLHDVFNPFSIGPRGCIGKPMAYMELSLALARLVWAFDMRLAPGELGRIGEGRKGLGRGRERETELQLEDIFVSNKVGPMAQFRPRQY
ncbi:Coagulation factor 5/8 type [Lasiodiplodia theobromae]|uniref:Cytochrome P450 monooxygenase apf7 n=1 Tax=Lasiodiplodia theobromae TaxID=45133 RepID=A0A5N5DRD0_9PEZI|nr:Cytochrome p450 monooxygenase [Lasiodiplodia theobromae]KAB2580509.1 Cytochrome P450 monooxygenase apf7 [Lasiodiplodia theobromae]KAF4540033.1 Cytochrome p450 monooxygenase [Lasiodiplodia theobromae]KAF9632556.1 Coagulation factor 5/8 type [Lasiodiplodia theobromae]